MPLLPPVMTATLPLSFTNVLPMGTSNHSPDVTSEMDVPVAKPPECAVALGHETHAWRNLSRFSLQTLSLPTRSVQFGLNHSRSIEPLWNFTIGSSAGCIPA